MSVEELVYCSSSLGAQEWDEAPACDHHHQASRSSFLMSNGVCHMCAVSVYLPASSTRGRLTGYRMQKIETFAICSSHLEFDFPILFSGTR